MYGFLKWAVYGCEFVRGLVELVVWGVILGGVLYLLSGCAVSKETYLADGTAGHSIDCSGSALTWGDCYEKAGSLCGANGYGVISKDGEDGASLTAVSGSVFGSSLMKRSMLVRCKD